MTAKTSRRPPAPLPPGAAAARPLPRRGAARVIPESAAEAGPLIERPDGWYWLAADGRQQFGPFASPAEARADRDRGDDDAPAEGESLVEAEAELGLADWIDPDTGALAEGLSRPHLDEAG